MVTVSISILLAILPVSRAAAIGVNGGGGKGPATLSPVTWLSPGGGFVATSGGTVKAQWTTAISIYSPSFSLCTATDVCGSPLWPSIVQNADHSFSATLSLPMIPSTPPVQSFFLRMNGDDQTAYDSAFFDVQAPTEEQAVVMGLSPQFATPTSGSTTAQGPATQPISSGLSSASGSVSPSVVPAETWPPGFALPGRIVSTDFATRYQATNFPAAVMATVSTTTTASSSSAGIPKMNLANQTPTSGKKVTVTAVVVSVAFVGAFLLMSAVLYYVRRSTAGKSSWSQQDDLQLQPGTPYPTWKSYVGCSPVIVSQEKSTLTSLPPRIFTVDKNDPSVIYRNPYALYYSDSTQSSVSSRSGRSRKSSEDVERLISGKRNNPNRLGEDFVHPQEAAQYLEPLRFDRTPIQVPESLVNKAPAHAIPFQTEPLSLPHSPRACAMPRGELGHEELLEAPPGIDVCLGNPPSTTREIRELDEASISRAVSLFSQYSTYTRPGDKSLARPDSPLPLKDAHKHISELYESLHAGRQGAL